MIIIILGGNVWYERVLILDKVYVVRCMFGRRVFIVMFVWYNFFFVNCFGWIIKLWGMNFNFDVFGVMVSCLFGGESLKVMFILFLCWSWGYIGWWKIFLWYLLFVYVVFV